MNNFYDTKTIHWIDSLKIPEYAFILLSSKRRSGKWIICKNLLKKISDDFDIDFIVIFSKTVKFTHDYDFLKKNKNCVMNDYDNWTGWKIKKIMDYQEKNILKNKNCIGIILFDDITQHKNNDYIWDLATYSRHLKLFVILSCQHAKKVVSTIVRNNLDLIFLNELTYSNELSLYEAMHVDFKYNEFHNFVNNHNENHVFILYDSNANKKDRIKLVRAENFDVEFEK